MKIERGIILTEPGYSDIVVRSPGHIYHLNYESFYLKSLTGNQNVLGVIIHDRYSVCREFISITGHIIFGFIINKGDSRDQFQIQTITGFDPNTFNPFEADYILGKQVTIEVN